MPRFVTKTVWLIIPALVATLGVAVAAEPDTSVNPKGKAKKPDGGTLARQTFGALNDLNKSVKKDAPTGNSAADLPTRPKKSVTAPTLTSAALDALVETFLATTKTPAAAITTDVEFVRRVYLDVTGRLPSPEQTRAFVTTHEKDKRAKLIDQLLTSKEYATNWARYWRDVIKYHATNDMLTRAGSYGQLEKWLADQLTKNVSWDSIAHDMITATGKSDENGAIFLTFAHDAQPVEMAGEISRIFLGVQIQCAQCHDHPNDSWKRQQFHEFAAFFAGTRQRRVNPKENPPVFEVVDQPKARYTMPDLKDPQKSIPVAPKFFLASTEAKSLPMALSPTERHELAASYVANQDNPWFAKAYVNRIWYVLMGEGFYNPVDDIGPERTAKAPEVLEALATQWQNGGYDIRWLFRTILNTQAYQREVRSTYSPSSKTPFACVSPSRLSADQILDSLAQALKLPIDGQTGGGGNGAMAKAAAKKGLAADLKGLAKKKGGGGGAPAAIRNNFNTLFGIDPSVPYDDVLGTIPQSLFLMNAPQVNRAIEARPGTILGEILGSTPNNLVALEALYLRVLARAPTPKEVQTCGHYVSTVGDRKEAFEDILWSLINSTEFITRR